MKKVFKLFSIPLIILLLTSCSKDSESSHKIDSKFLVEKNYNEKYLAKIDSYLNEKSSLLRSGEIIQFDYDNTSFVQNQENTNYFSITAREINYNENDFYTISFLFDENSDIFRSYILKTVKVDDFINEVSFYNAEDNSYQFKVIFNKNENVVQIESDDINSKTKSCGQQIADCVSDAYTNDGWASVGLGILTAFVPETAVAAVLVCASQSCR